MFNEIMQLKSNPNRTEGKNRAWKTKAFFGIFAILLMFQITITYKRV